MSAQPAEKWVSEAEFWQLVETSQEKWEWHAGRVFRLHGPTSMAGGGYLHSRLIENLASVLKHHLRGQKCSASGSNFHIQIETTGTKLLPHNAIHCENPRFESPQRRALLNPVVVFEVLSPSTEKYDQNEKFDLYAQIESLSDYVLIAQDFVRVSHYARQGDGWLLRRFTHLEDVLKLPAVELEIPLAELYDELETPVRLALFRPETEEN